MTSFDRILGGHGDWEWRGFTGRLQAERALHWIDARRDHWMRDKQKAKFQSSSPGENARFF